MSTIFIAVAALGSLGLLFGLILSYIGIKLGTEEDPKLAALRELLPGVNCGGCGLAGCSAFAEDLFAGKADSGGCPAGDAELSRKLAEVMGLSAPEFIRMTAYVKCIGSNTRSKSLYNYKGFNDCRAQVKQTGGGPKACGYGCLGGGNCYEACVFDAIRIVDGVAVIDNEKCTGCTVCIRACPKDIIDIAPYENGIRMRCDSRDSARVVRANCDAGCIGCQLCEKSCEHDAIRMEGNLAVIDYEKCTACNACVEPCPRKCIGL